MPGKRRKKTIIGETMELLVPAEVIERKIFLIRGQRVMIDAHLAELYGVSTKRLNEQVKRNLKKFPPDFMFPLNREETAILRSQFATSRLQWGGRRYSTYAFTEQGVAMLSSVLNSDRAIEVNIQIMRTFVKLREMIVSHKDLARKLNELEKKYDKNFKVVFEAIRALMAPPETPKKKIGFNLKEPKAGFRKK
jgi:hypothetical protein